MSFFRALILTILSISLMLPIGSVYSKSIRDDSLKIACMASGDISGQPADPLWCQCQNDYYANLLTDADWNKYVFDYYALLRAKSSQKSTPANSYARKVQIGNSHCIQCKDKNDSACLNDDGHTPSKASYTNVLNDIRDGAFNEISNNILFKNLYVDYLNGYSAFCGDKIEHYVDRTITSTEWKSIDQVWWQGDTSVFKVRVDQRMFKTFESYEQQAQNDLLFDIGKDMFEDYIQGRLPISAIGKTLKRIAEPVAFMRGHLAGKCDTPEVVATYENLYRFSMGQTPYINPQFAAKRAFDNEKDLARKTKIIAATQRSAENSKRINTEQKRLDVLKPKPSFYCPDARKNGEQLATVLKSLSHSEGDDFSNMHGAWRGDWNGSEIEIAAWTTPRARGAGSPGLAYIVKYNCLMITGFRGERSSARQNAIAEMNFRMLSPTIRADNCAAMVLEDRDREIHYFEAQGFISFDSLSKQFSWYPNAGKLSKMSPQICENTEVNFTPSKASPAFLKLISQYNDYDKRGIKMPADFLEKIK